MSSSRSSTSHSSTSHSGTADSTSSTSPSSSSSSTSPSSSSTPSSSSSSSNPTSVSTTPPSNSNSISNSNTIPSNTASSTPPLTSASTPTATTVISTQFVTTNAEGSSTTVYSTSTSTGLAPVNHNNGSSSSHLGAIVGGTVGGVVGFVLLLLAAWFIARRRKRDEFDGDFDPDSIAGPYRGGGGRQSLVPDGPDGAEVTPFVMQDQRRGPALPQMGEYNTGIPATLTAGGAGYAAGTQPRQSFSSPSDPDYPQSESSYLPNPYPAGSDRSDYALGQGRQDPARSPTQATSSAYSQFSQPRSAKEREVYAQRYGAAGGSGQRPLVLANSSGEDAEGSEVIVHQDGGRIPERNENHEGQGAREIPPTYDSLPQSERY